MKAKALLIATALTALAFGAAQAAEPKVSSIVSGDSVTVGDVFDGAGAFADRYLAPAPEGSLVLNAHDLKRISDAFGLGWQPATNRESVVVRRERAGTDRYAIAAAVQDALAAQLPGRGFEAELSDPSASMRGTGVKAVSMKFDVQKGTFSALLSTDREKKEVNGRLHLLERVPVLKAAMRAGEIIDAHDIEYVEMRAAEIPASMILKAEQLVGQTPRRNVGAMKPVMAADIGAPVMVKKGEMVTVSLNSGALNLVMQAKALQAGAEGDVVRVLNTASNRTLEGVVTGPQAVSLKAL